jgi:hypothetical protein
MEDAAVAVGHFSVGGNAPFDAFCAYGRHGIGSQFYWFKCALKVLSIYNEWEWIFCYTVMTELAEDGDVGAFCFLVYTGESTPMFE